MLRLHSTTVPPSYASEVWGLRHMMYLMRNQREGIQKQHVSNLRRICGVRQSVTDTIIQQELGLKPLPDQWQQQALRLWNLFAALPNGSLYKTIAQDDLNAATQGQRNWAAGLRDSLMSHKVTLVDSSGVMQQISKADIAKAAAAATSAKQQRLAAMDPRIAPSNGEKLCTYLAWFARPAWASGPHFWQLSLSAPQQRAVMRLLLGSHQLPIEKGRHQKPPQPRHLRTCTACDAGVVGDEKHLLLECGATAGVRQQFADLFAQPNVAMHQLVWHKNRRHVAAFLLQCLAAVNLISSSSANDN